MTALGRLLFEPAYAFAAGYLKPGLSNHRRAASLLTQNGKGYLKTGLNRFQVAFLTFGRCLERFHRVLVVGVDADAAGDFQRFFHHGFGRQLGVFHQRAGGSLGE